MHWKFFMEIKNEDTIKVLLQGLEGFLFNNIKFTENVKNHYPHCDFQCVSKRPFKC